MNQLWLPLGLLGQAAFAGRFLIQWLATERAGRSVVPPLFWVLSIMGSMLLLAYAIHRRDPIFIVGQTTGSFIYLRNLLLIDKERKTASRSA